MSLLSNGFDPSWSQAEKDAWAASGASRIRAAATPKAKSAVTLVRGDAIQIERIRWLWDGWLARRKMHVIAGAPGAGKSTIAYSLTAAITSGGAWPDGSKGASPGNVIIWSSEDDSSDTIKPRLVAMGADVKRVYFVKGVTEDGRKRAFDPSKDMDALADAVAAIGDVALIIIDSIAEAVSGDSHKNTETRRGLQPIVDLAQAADAALLGIAHFTKGTSGRSPIDRITGSLAFGAMARIVMVAAKNEGEEGPARVVARAKSNIGPDGGGFAYDLEQRAVPREDGMFASCVAWGEPLDGSARELLAQVEGEPATGGDGEALKQAKTFLGALLAEGPMAAKDVLAEAGGAGIAKRTIERAKKELGIVATRFGFGSAGGFRWSLPMFPGEPVIDRQVIPIDRQWRSMQEASKSGPSDIDRQAQSCGDLCEDDAPLAATNSDLAAYDESPGKLGENHRPPMATNGAAYGDRLAVYGEASEHEEGGEI